MTEGLNSIALNFLEITPKSFDVHYYTKLVSEIPPDEVDQYFKCTLDEGSIGEGKASYAIVFRPTDGFAKKVALSKLNIALTKRYLLHLLEEQAAKAGLVPFPSNYAKYRRILFPLQAWNEGTETIWLEPYYLAKADSFGLLIDYKFNVSSDYKAKIGTTVDKRILQLSGTLDSKGLANKAFYQFKYGKLREFVENHLVQIEKLEAEGTTFDIASNLTKLPSEALETKTYQFGNGKESSSPFFGLQRNPPFAEPDGPTNFLFVFREADRNLAVSLLKGLRGEWSPSTFAGVEKMFRLDFTNERVRGKKVTEITRQVLTEIVSDVLEDKEKGETTLPIVITRSKATDSDDELYYAIKHAFIKNDIACQVVTKDLIVNSNALKYSLSNIALQMFAKAGGKPWIVKPAISQCLIVGIGSKNKQHYVEDDHGGFQKVTEKFLAYSVLTDSSGLFKEIQVLSEAESEDEYYQHLITKLASIISQASLEGYKEIVVHSPFRISKARVWDIVFQNIPDGLNVSVLVINNDHKYFGYDLSKNALVPYESSFIQISKHEYLVWFEGLQYQNSVFSKRIGGPVYINFWHANNPTLLANTQYRRRLLQDCINLSGANWRGFKAKQLPVSIYYCQKIADFLKRFDDYGLEQIELQNLKPWFL